MTTAPIGLPHSPQNFSAFSNFAPQLGQVFLAVTTGGGAAAGAAVDKFRFNAIHFGQHPREFLLQLQLGGLVILVGDLVDAVLELEIAQVLINDRLVLVQMLERRNGLRFWKIFQTDEQQEAHHNGSQQRSDNEAWVHLFY